MSTIKLKIAQTQLKFLLELSKTIQGAFATDQDQTEEEALAELPKSTVEPARQLTNQSNEDQEVVPPPTSQGPELESSPEVWTKLDFLFDAPTIAFSQLVQICDQRNQGEASPKD